MLKAQSRNPRGGAAPQERLGRGKGSGRARDVVRGQDGHDDGNNMMRAPSRRLSAPMNKDLKGEGGCAWPPPPALGSRIRSSSELLSSRCSLVIPPQSCKLGTDIQNMQRERRQARPSHGQACWACRWSHSW